MGAATNGNGEWRPPRGRHRVPEFVVAENQRQRLLAGAATAMAEHGYAQMSVAHIIAAAGVSRTTFYKNFDNKIGCVVAAHDAAFARLMAQVLRACGAERKWVDKVVAGLDAALEFAAHEPEAARLLVLDAVGAEPVLVSRVITSDEYLVGLLRAGRDHHPEMGSLPALTERAMISGAASIVGSRLLAGEADRLPQLRPQLAQLILMPYVGAEEARRIAA
ncbi:MAG TPA: TetR/AcrR family transcriptional regulator [Solirubrobacterales bacterium]|nr:TetR/AcrR family transcriptional regulator [Solirubrobacterales bacterium]